VAIGVSGCDQLAGGSGESDRIAKLEARVTALESQVKQNSDDKALRTHLMSLCLAGANEAYWKYVELNGHKRRQPDEDGSDVWMASPHVWDSAAKIKENAIEECRIRHGGP
jgi:hypothetical protein